MWCGGQRAMGGKAEDSAAVLCEEKVDNSPCTDCGVCAEVRPLLRTVFRELDYLPPLATEDHPPAPLPPELIPDEALPALNLWTEKFKSECDQIWTQEGEIKHQHAQRLAREPLPNIYQLHSPPSQPKAVPQWRVDRGLIDRGDLVPTIEQDAGRNGTLWIRNILNASSGDVRDLKVTGVQIAPPADKCTIYEENTIQTLSIGAIQPCPPPVPTPPPPPPVRHDYILCVPPQLHFVDFVVGHVHTQSIRLINVSNVECRLSVSPPKRRELTVEICGLRGLTVTSGADAQLKIHFRPVHVRTVQDELPVRVSCGQTFAIPIACYMQPPILDVIVSNVTPTLLFCTPDEPPAYTAMHESTGGPDVVELGTQLLGDVHCARLVLHCDLEQSAFFVLTEDAWISWTLDCLSSRGSVLAPPFVFWPAWWCGGGTVSAYAWCRGDVVGTHLAPLRIISSTAVIRQLYLLADVVYFKPNHLLIEAHPKDYDICSEDDRDCEYYVHVGTAFPHRSLTTTIKLVNTSPVIYSYYWVPRPWGICWCWQDEVGSDSDVSAEQETERLCPGALEAFVLSKKDPEAYEKQSENMKLVNIEPGRSQILPRTTCTLQVRLPDVGGKLGVQRAVLMLMLKDVPKDSFPPDYEPVVISTKEIEEVSIPGLKKDSYTREVCDVLVAQMEVWWEVVPVMFVLEPVVLPITYSRRLTSISINLNAWQLYGVDESCVEWLVPERVRKPPPLRLNTERGATTTINLPLPELPNHYPETDILTMVASNQEWKAESTVTRQCATRYPALRPAAAWLGVVPPATHMQSIFTLTNDTYQNICYWCEGFRWIGENQPSPACQGEIPCDRCQELTCTCGFLNPRRGALGKDKSTEICYDVNAPKRDGCVVTLIQVRRCEPDLGRVHPAPATESRASMVAYRVLAPRVVLRLLPCFGGNPECGAGCGLDPGELGSKLGTATLRPSSALVIGRRSCYRLRVTNITPLPTVVSFDEPIDSPDLLSVKFMPNQFSVRRYGTKEIRVVLEARKVCDRRVFVYRARVMRAHQPVYLLVDTAITGLEISVQLPMGGGPKTDDFVTIRRTQRPEQPGDRDVPPLTPNDLFLQEDLKRQYVQDNICKCKNEMVYIPPVKRPEPPCPYEEVEYPTMEILTAPPALTQVCPCHECSKPVIPDAPHSFCIEFREVPLRTVWERRVVLYNESVVTARWNCYVRMWPRVHRRTLDKDQWAPDVGPPGVVVACSPARGVLAGHARADVLVQVYADCWGIYWDQIVIQVENLEPIVVDVWIEAVGPPLQIKLQPSLAATDLPTLWLSSSDPVRSLIVRNVSRAELLVHAYLTYENAHIQDVLPFRLYLRFTDVAPITCPCCLDDELVAAARSEHSSDVQEMDTDIEVYLAPDHGPQCDNLYQVTPEVCTVQPGELAEWTVSLAPLPNCEIAPDAALLLRLIPVDRSGYHWCRGEPLPQVVRLRQAPRLHRLKLSCEQVVVKVCALNLPYGDYLKIRKHFNMQNVGNEMLEVNVHTSVPWCVVHRCGSGCECELATEHRTSLLQMLLPPFSSTEMCVEVCVSTMEVWPLDASLAVGPYARPPYPPHRRDTTPLHIYDDYQVLLTLPLVLDVEYPVIETQPAAVDFGYVTDGDTRKTYVTVTHTSSTETLLLETQWIGSTDFEIYPTMLEIPPGGSERFYIQYTAAWRLGHAEGCAVVSACSGRGGAGAGRVPVERRAGWCRAGVLVRAAPTRDHKCHAPPHDHTDDPHLLPPTLIT